MIRSFNFLVFVVAFSVSLVAQGEYRVFELELVNEETGTTRTITSTLDHLQYPKYYPLRKQEYARYVTSWMCWGSTNGKKPCPRPDQATAMPTAKNNR